MTPTVREGPGEAAFSDVGGESQPKSGLRRAMTAVGENDVYS